MPFTDTRVADQAPLSGKVRRRDPDGSWDAAKINRAEWSELQGEVVDILRERGPLTDEAIFREYLARRRGAGLPARKEQRVRTARKELQLRGFITDSPLPGKTRSGNPCATRMLTEKAGA